MIRILTKNNVNNYIKEKFKYLTDNEHLLLNIINLIEVEIDFFIYERIIIYTFQKNNVLLPFKPINKINEILVKVYNQDKIIEINNVSYEKNQNNLIIKSDVVDNIHNPYNFLEYVVSYEVGYILEDIFIYFPLLLKIIEDTYINYILHNKFEIENKSYLDFLKKNISLLL
jgi:hypothetical protein